MNSPSEDVKDFLEAESIGLTFGLNLFISEIPDGGAVPDLAVGVFDSGGAAPRVDYTEERPTVQVLVRGNRGGYLEAHAMAQTCRDALGGKANETINGARYILVRCLTDVLSVGYDENHRPLLSVNFELIRTVA